MKKIVLLAVLLAGVAAWGFSQTSGSWTVNSTATWITAVNGIRNGGNNKAYTITVTGTVSVPLNTERTFSESTFGAGTGITVTMEGSGTVSISGNDTLVIGTDQTIIAKNITLRGRDNDNVIPVVWIKKGGAFRMEGSAQVTDNNSGGVVVWGTFTMQDKSSVSGNTDNSKNGGGGVYFSSGGTFTMQDSASVSGNTARGSGGGVSVNSGTFTMEGGTVSGNTGSSGGGVLVSGTFTMQGGVLSGNTAAKDGGGVYVKAGGTFTKTGGTIYGNDGEPRLRNTASSKKGHAVYNEKGGNWRNSTADSTMKPDSYGFWLSEEE